jgi:two-component system KDP operon response regulator KdpE
MFETKRSPRVLVIDDDHDFLEMLDITLSAQGFDVLLASSALAGLRSTYTSHPDAILLDVMMPNVDGFETCSRLREITDAPIIFLTAKGSFEDIVHGLSLGADDYVVKPFNTAELVSRLRACLRVTDQPTREKDEILFPTHSMALDCGRHELIIENHKIYLTPKEFEVLRLLLRHAGKVLTTDAILLQVWGAKRLGELQLVKQYVYRLRQKIEVDPSNPQYIKTARGDGYYFDAHDLL